MEVQIHLHNHHRLPYWLGLKTRSKFLGDEVKRICLETKDGFENIVFKISDYAYPQFISGLQFNPDRVNMPKHVDGFVNMLRRMKTRYSKWFVKIQ